MRRLSPNGVCPICAPLEPALVEAAQAEPGGDAAAELDAEIAQLERELLVYDAAGALECFPEFMRQAWHVIGMPLGTPHVKNRVSDAFEIHLQAVGDGLIDRLAVAVWPGSGKSSYFSVGWPAWMLARDPRWRAICASHTFSFAAKDLGGRFLRVVQSDWYRVNFPHVRIKSDAVGNFETESGGARIAFGVDQGIVGVRADGGALIVDDSIAPKAAEVPENLVAVNQWYDRDFCSRARDAVHVVVQQALGKDIVWHCAGKGYEVLELGARFHSDRRRARTSVWTDTRETDDELLAPEVWGPDWVAEKELDVGPQNFLIQFDQVRDLNRSGGRFATADWRYFQIGGDGAPRARPPGCWQGSAHVLERRPDGGLDVDRACVSIDGTFGATGDGASALGIVLWCKLGELRLVEDRTPGPRTWNQTKLDVRAAIVALGQLVGKQRRPFTVLVEKKAIGGADEAPLPTELREAIASGALRYPDGSPISARVVLYEPSGKGNKSARAQVLEGPVAAGQYLLRDGAPWLEKFHGVVGAFPAGKADQVDCLSQAEDHFRAEALGGGVLDAMGRRARARRRR